MEMNEMKESFYEMSERVQETVQAYLLRNCDQVKAQDLGLDSRAGYRLFVNSECIVVSDADDRSLQYYGGFEYVDKEYRTALGDWVFYSADDDRVQEHIATYYERADA